ncbi:hypothetical protein M9458_017358, partial [Cirrhinus mrigala]
PSYSVSSTVGRYHGLDPTWLLLLQVPSVISLAPPFVVSTLDSSSSRRSILSSEPPPKFPSLAPFVVV